MSSLRKFTFAISSPDEFLVEMGHYEALYTFTFFTFFSLKQEL